MGDEPETETKLYAAEWPFLTLDYDQERALGRLRSRLAPRLRNQAGFSGLIVLVRGGIESTRYDRRKDRNLSFDCCQVRCLALWDEEASMLKAAEQLTGTFRSELEMLVFKAERRRLYHVVYGTFPRETERELSVYATITEVQVRFEDLEEAIGRTAASVAPALAKQPGSRGVLVLRSYGEPSVPREDREVSDVGRDSALAGTEPAARRSIRAYQHWCVGLWETQQDMEDANEVALRSVFEELGDLIPRGWWVDRSNYEGVLLT